MRSIAGDILLRTCTHGSTWVGRPAKTHIYPPCMDSEFSLEELPGERERERKSRELRAVSAT